MKIPQLEDLLQAGVQFGHKPERTHPKAKKYIFGIRDGINVIDLEKVQLKLAPALDFIAQNSSEGKIIIFVGTKKQIREKVKKSAEKCGVPYINQRWLGGMLTNFETIKKSIRRLEALEAEIASTEYQKLTKKEKLIIANKKNKLLKSLQGIRSLSKIPDVLFIIDTAKEYTAVSEARTTDIPIVGVCDTDANPDLISYPIPANDDATKSVDLILTLVSEAVLEGKAKSVKSTSKTNKK